MDQERKVRREIANSNERRRMQSINAGFQSLRSLLPQDEGDKLSKAAILQQTAEYIYSLEQEKTRLLAQNCQLKRLLSQSQSDDKICNQQNLEGNVSTVQELLKQAGSSTNVSNGSASSSLDVNTSNMQLITAAKLSAAPSSGTLETFCSNNEFQQVGVSTAGSSGLQYMVGLSASAPKKRRLFTQLDLNSSSVVGGLGNKSLSNSSQMSDFSNIGVDLISKDNIVKIITSDATLLESSVVASNTDCVSGSSKENLLNTTASSFTLIPSTPKCGIVVDCSSNSLVASSENVTCTSSTSSSSMIPTTLKYIPALTANNSTVDCLSSLEDLQSSANANVSVVCTSMVSTNDGESGGGQSQQESGNHHPTTIAHLLLSATSEPVPKSSLFAVAGNGSRLSISTSECGSSGSPQPELDGVMKEKVSLINAIKNDSMSSTSCSMLTNSPPSLSCLESSSHPHPSFNIHSRLSNVRVAVESIISSLDKPIPHGKLPHGHNSTHQTTGEHAGESMLMRGASTIVAPPPTTLVIKSVPIELSTTTNSTGLSNSESVGIQGLGVPSSTVSGGGGGVRPPLFFSSLSRAGVASSSINSSSQIPPPHSSRERSGSLVGVGGSLCPRDNIGLLLDDRVCVESSDSVNNRCVSKSKDEMHGFPSQRCYKPPHHCNQLQASSLDSIVEAIKHLEGQNFTTSSTSTNKSSKQEMMDIIREEDAIEVDETEFESRDMIDDNGV